MLWYLLLFSFPAVLFTSVHSVFTFPNCLEFSCVEKWLLEVVMMDSSFISAALVATFWHTVLSKKKTSQSIILLGSTFSVLPVQSRFLSFFLLFFFYPMHAPITLTHILLRVCTYSTPHTPITSHPYTQTHLFPVVDSPFFRCRQSVSAPIHLE